MSIFRFIMCLEQGRINHWANRGQMPGASRLNIKPPLHCFFMFLCCSLLVKIVEFLVHRLRKLTISAFSVFD